MDNSIMKRSTILLIYGLILALMLLAGCAEIQTSSTQNNNSQLANPASTNCIDKGGTLKIVDNADGQTGICTLADGTECDEWEFLAGTCPESVHTCTPEEKKTEMCTMEYMPVCGDDSVTYGNKCSACASNKIDSYTKGECVNHCGACPILSPPAPDFCKNGKIIAGPNDICNCPTAPICEDNGSVACTMDAKVCPDGTAVGRTGPNCEFAPCPIAGGKKVPHYCGEETPRTNACTKEYRPVCGFFSDTVKCIRAPCAIDASNPCMACNNQDVDYWVEGECNSLD